jgi:hypothetical protein
MGKKNEIFTTATLEGGVLPKGIIMGGTDVGLPEMA